MKKALFCLLVLLSRAGLFAQSQLNLVEAITRSGRDIEGALAQNVIAAVLNFASPSPAFSDYVIEELTGVLVNGKKLTVVDRRNLELLGQEMNLQLSGEVSDESAQALGKKIGAQSIISGNLADMGQFYRFRIKVINVETAAIQTQISLDLRNDEQVAFLLGGSGSSAPVPARAGGGGGTGAIQGTVVPGATLAAKIVWLQRSADSHNTYIVEISADENIGPAVLEYTNAINITVVLRGDGINRTVRLQSHGIMFTVKPNVTFILDGSVTLMGHAGNSGAIVYADGGAFKMNEGSIVSGNGWAGVCLGERYRNSGTFTMDGGVISGNSGGGVLIRNGSFTMNGGTVSGNSTKENGGGVSVASGSFTMSGGAITGNSAKYGGGVFTAESPFTMKGGTVSGNSAKEYGGGVYVGPWGKFDKTGGVITGYGSDPGSGNVVKDEAGVLARRGHAVSVSESQKRKETGAGEDVNLSYASNGHSGAWDN